MAGNIRDLPTLSRSLDRSRMETLLQGRAAPRLVGTSLLHGVVSPTAASQLTSRFSRLATPTRPTTGGRTGAYVRVAPTPARGTDGGAVYARQGFEVELTPRRATEASTCISSSTRPSAHGCSLQAKSRSSACWSCDRTTNAGHHRRHRGKRRVCLRPRRNFASGPQISATSIHFAWDSRTTSTCTQCFGTPQVAHSHGASACRLPTMSAPLRGWAAVRR